MQNLILVPADELRQMIREELSLSNTPPAPQRQATKPLTQQELCRFLGLSEPTLINWRKKGKIPFMKIGAAIRYDVDAVLRSLEVINKKGGRS